MTLFHSHGIVESKCSHTLGASVTGVESLAYLRELKQHYDVVFVCVPNNKENIFPSILEATRHLDVDNAVLLHSNNESLSNRSDLSQYFSHQMHLPLTLGKLTSLLRCPGRKSHRQITTALSLTT